MNRAIALGTFDGLHRAHCKVLDLPKEYSKTAITFKKPPKMYSEVPQELIMDFSDKVAALEKLGFTQVVALDFEQVKQIEPLDFLDYITENFKPSLISCGFNYRFGKGGKGDTALLRDYCEKNGIECRICKEVRSGGETVSSTAIRNLLKNGEIKKANSLMYEPFSFSGVVKSGDARGRQLGYPTVNQDYPDNLVKVKFGVYKSRVTVMGKTYSGLTNIGIRPTFETDHVTSETFIKRFSGDLYNKVVKISLKEYLREEIKFASAEELRKQIEIDLTK